MNRNEQKRTSSSGTEKCERNCKLIDWRHSHCENRSEFHCPSVKPVDLGSQSETSPKKIYFTTIGKKFCLSSKNLQKFDKKFTKICKKFCCFYELLVLTFVLKTEWKSFGDLEKRPFIKTGPDSSWARVFEMKRERDIVWNAIGDRQLSPERRERERERERVGGDMKGR